MKKKHDRDRGKGDGKGKGKGSVPRNPGVLLLRDLSPVEDVQGGTAKRLFGERAADQRQPPRASRYRKGPKD